MHGFDDLRKSDYWIGDRIKVSASRNVINVRGQKEIKLQPRLISVLTILASKSPEVVPREEVIQTVWTDYYTGDLALNQCISKLRKVLGDSAVEPQVIETVVKSGYRLTKPIRTSQQVRPYGLSIKRLRLMGTGLLGTLALIYLGWSLNKKPEPVLLMKDPDNLLSEQLYQRIQELADHPESYEEVVKELQKAFPDSTFEITANDQSLMILSR